MSHNPPRNFSLLPRCWQAKDLVNASMSTSQALNSRLSGLSQSGRDGPFVMKFHSEWLHKNCPTYAWYKSQEQYGQRQESSTRFRSIQHRRTRDAPFFHEFLLLQVVDGSIYRVERIGVGSNTDAILPTGCMAQDLIEWFPSEAYNLFTRDKPTDLILEIRFPTDFDLLDLLAICYSIQRGPRTKTYTLQRYNCYFFCCTILSVLARRSAGWETLITADLWDRLLTKALDQVPSSINSPPLVDSKPHIISRLFSMLSADPNKPSQCLVEALRRRLGSEAGGYNSFVRAYATAMWWSDVSISLAEHLGAHIHASALETCSQDQTCATVFGFEGHTAVDDEKNAAAPDAPTVQMYKANYLTLLGGLMDRRRKTTLNALYREQRIPWGAHLLASACGPTVGVTAAVLKMSCKKRREWAQGVSWFRRMAYAASWGRTVGPHIVLSYVTTQEFKRADWVTHSNSETDISTLEIPVLHAVLDRLVTGPYKTVDVQLAIEQCFAGFMEKDRDVWGERIVGPLLYSALEEGANEILRAKAGQLELLTLEGDKLNSVKTDIETFQQHIRNRIKAHAQRVDTYKLSVARFVSRDVETAIAEVWKSMPPALTLVFLWDFECLVFKDLSLPGPGYLTQKPSRDIGRYRGKNLKTQLLRSDDEIRSVLLENTRED
ncbi:hypothetical protein BDV93DRAFT_594334 [Ceratobasidium sp. AG-I]|nr:hypothetical protein BDV93DRAFT_594334 [Ceratobasidium sp. AG-I]